MSKHLVPRVLAVLSAAAFVTACGTSVTPTAPATPTTETTAPLPDSFVLTGRVTDAATSAPIAGATVWFDGLTRTTTDGSGTYGVAGSLVWRGPRGIHDFALAVADGFFIDYHYITATTHDIRLRRIERIVAGESTKVTVSPDDTLCVNNMQDYGPPWDYVCRTVLVVAPGTGAITIDAVSTQNGSHPVLEVETRGVLPCCSERLENPTTLRVSAGIEVAVSVQLPSTSRASQSYVVNTAFSPE
jgi:hypothetical protein